MPPLLEALRITKRFPGVLALDEVSLQVHPGEVLAVIGENGAGKSTLMKVLAGVHAPDSGEIRVGGVRAAFRGVRDALHAGVALIHQELNLSDNLDIGANLFLGREPRRFGLIDHRRVHREAAPLLHSVGLECSSRSVVGDLSIGHRQMVEIAKALSVDARVIIMDEPTSSLTHHESLQLRRVIKGLCARGVGVVYISHRLDEVCALADRVAVLRDARNAGDLARDEIDHDRMVGLMIGRDLSQFYQRRARTAGAPLLEVDQLRTAAHTAHPLSFQVREGEIVGVAGLVGAGRTELLRTLFGIDRPAGGEVRLRGQPLPAGGPAAAIRAGLALVPEDRKLQGVIIEMAIRENLSLPGVRRTSRAGCFLNRAWERRSSGELVEQLRIKTPNDLQAAATLSGGNQQKVALGKWLPLKPRLLLLDEPTRGIDIGAKQEIYHLMDDLAAGGIGILFVSSELTEILGMSDRILVMHQGRIRGELSAAEASEEAVMQLATGNPATGAVEESA